jgi:hypothetical protein
MRCVVRNLVAAILTVTLATMPSSILLEGIDSTADGNEEQVKNDG